MCPDIRVKPQFELADEFSNGLAAVEVGGKAEKFGERLYRHISGKWAYISKTGEIIIPPRFDFADQFSEGLARIKLGDKWGYIDKTGKIIIQPQYQWSSKTNECGHFSEGLACIQINGKIGYIDTRGNIVITPQFDVASKFTGGLAQVVFGGLSPVSPGSDIVGFRGKWAYIDKSGRYVWEPSQ
jgi:hypothetical protein